MITSIPNAFAAEALACVQAIQFGAESGYLRVDIEGDAPSILRKLQDDLDNRSKIRAYILNVNRLKRNFIYCKFKYASRIGNNVARTLAKKGLRVGDDTYLNNRLSGAVLTAVAEDCRGLLRNRELGHGWDALRNRVLERLVRAWEMIRRVTYKFWWLVAALS
ncbi:hypothetical protein Goari_024243 [Gossypium aridum]|uniref:RNase H type-1 domain-containing protein n=1 Tax=Gossypium aridum TaxID=34290 RepID=A0A7J8X5I5_GOSAI|nr:hypothetical protein [Gossypium aridum]